MLSRLAVVLLWLLHLLPLPVLSAIGRGFGLLLYQFGSRRRPIVLVNLALCFPEKSEAQREQLAKAHFQVLGRSMLERGLLWWASRERLSRLIRVEGEEKIQALLDAKRPVMLLAPHFVGLDAGGVAITMRFDIVSIYAVQNEAVFDHLILKGRSRFGKQLLLSRRDGARSSIKAMKSGRPFTICQTWICAAATRFLRPFLAFRLRPSPHCQDLLGWQVRLLFPAPPGCFRADKAMSSRLAIHGRTTRPTMSKPIRGE